MRSIRCFISVLFACGVMLASWGAVPASAQVLSCPTSGSGGDNLDRGFYVENYTAGSIGTVELTYTGGASGTYMLTLTMHDGSYSGTVLGSSTVSADLSDSTGTLVTFDFGGVAVPSGHTVAFVQTLVSGPSGFAFFDTGPCDLSDTTCTSCPNVVETNGTSAPLDTFRRGSVGLAITAGAEPPVPTQGALGLILMAAGLLAAGLFVIRQNG